MKKLFLFILLILWIPTSFANLEVKSNLSPWNYNFPIEINLIVNDKNAKIFYYTDGIWRMDSIKEYTHPILLKENTTLDYYATNKNFEDTKIQTSNYTFTYSNKLSLIINAENIQIKNNSWDIQNIWYWTVQANTFSYTIPANTFLENKEIYTISYLATENEKIFLKSPDMIQKQTAIYTPSKSETKITPASTSEISSQDQTPDLFDETNIISNIENTQNFSEHEINTNTQILDDNPLISFSWKIIPDTPSQDISYSFTNNMKTSSLESNQTSWYYGIILFILLLLWVILYNILSIFQIKYEKQIKTWKK